MENNQRYQQSLEQRVLRFIRENNLATGQRLLVAVSGGPDSVCLLHILIKLRDELGIKLHVAHLDHQLRGTESEADARYVSGLAEQLGIPATIGRFDVRAYRARRRISLEAAAREARYNFLSEVAEAVETDRVATGHTADDNVETILMHLIRGTGTRGLRGLQPASRWQPEENSLTIIRPLLPISRQETRDYCQNCHLEPRNDASNLLPFPLRNRIRHELLPLLESYNPRIRESLLRTALIASDDLAFLERESARMWGSLVRRQGEAVLFDKRGFPGLPVSLQRHLFREALAELSGNLENIEAHHIEQMIALVRKPAGKRLSLPGGLVFSVEYERCLLAPEPALSPLPTIEGEYLLEVPGETFFPGWRVTATVIKPERMAEPENKFTAYLSLDKVGKRLTVRCRQAGDRFQPLGMQQSKKLGEFMIDARIPRLWRPWVPLVCSAEHILWVVGWRISDRAKVTAGTEQVLRLEFEPAVDCQIGTQGGYPGKDNGLG